MQQFTKGEDCWFITKFRDVATGEYVGTEMIPCADGEKLVHVIMSDNAFGPGTTAMGVNCIVTDKALRRGQPPQRRK